MDNKYIYTYIYLCFCRYDLCVLFTGCNVALIKIGDYEKPTNDIVPGFRTPQHLGHEELGLLGVVNH